MSHRLSLVLAVAVSAFVAGCDQNMTDQPKYQQYEPADLFRDGKTLQPPVAGTVAREDQKYREDATIRPPLTKALLARGQSQFNTYCSPCHSRTGDGNGMVVQRGMPAPPSYHIQRLREADDQHFFDVMTNGYGVMYSYASRVRPKDRWAIVAYIRALQLSQNAALDDVPDEEKAKLSSEAKP
jgi:mono/diheme cytochrome c family protein